MAPSGLTDLIDSLPQQSGGYRDFKADKQGKYRIFLIFETTLPKQGVQGRIRTL